jgi:hypothetical protein
MTQRLSFKSGSSWKATMGYTPTPGLAPATLASVTITSQIRTKEGKLIADMVVGNKTSNSFELSVADTSGWPADVEALWDIKMVDATYGTFYTETVVVALQRRVTA